MNIAGIFDKFSILIILCWYNPSIELESSEDTQDNIESCFSALNLSETNERKCTRVFRTSQ